ncbi:uncharacterized protein LOC109523554 isoform X3 [Hippocampus comes]|uniref:uncharacterized protein LOC109523554 isoform X3 n=1 Tax=Hippocampus comes TaxID=109280 RepID=UPI00094EE2D7|nr:PREDICTED: uncharacterized protein LOC109523554 isoform X3 [Hippocampus comes]
MLPNQLQEEDSKALGVGYEPESDKLRILASINFSKKRGKMRTGLDLREEEVRRSTPEPLSRRLLLGQIASLYDPIGLVTPAKQKGVILVRESFQEARKDRPVKDTWDDPLSPRLREAAVTLFEEYVRLGQIRFDRSLTPSEVLGSPVGRIQSWNEGKIAIPLVPMHTRLATLLALEAHEKNHEGVAATLLRTRERAWIIQGRRVVRKVINDCIHCRKQRARVCQQVMSDLPLERTQRAGPFEYTTLDLFGPYEVKDAVKGRVRKKVWGIIFCCMASRAVHADVCDDQSSESFLLAYSRFVSLRGHPRKLWSDKGTNFIGAKPALNELQNHLRCVQTSSVEDIASKNGTDWAWSFHPADAPHRNGAAEAAVKLIKRALTSLKGATDHLTWGEFQTLLFQAANLTNERPIDAHAQEQEESIDYITPNSLILGRSSVGGDTDGLDLVTHPWRRLRNIHNLVDRFWTKWKELAGPNLFVREKWHTKQRNVKEGDVVWIVDPNAVRGQFRLGRVTATRPDKHGVVRDVDVKVCAGLPMINTVRKGRTHLQLPPTIILQRDVRRLVVLIPAEDFTPAATP